jgi:hypothetical protein
LKEKNMSRMSELNILLVESLEVGLSDESIIELMVMEGVPREACPEMLRVFKLSEDENDGQPDEAQEWHDFDPDC